MKRFTSIALIFGLFAAKFASAIPNLNSGEPGCLRTVMERPVSDNDAKSFTPACRAFRTTYLESLKLYAKSPKLFEAELIQSLKQNQTPVPAYGAILMAALFEDSKLVPALESRAQIEKSKKFRFQYAAAALERLKTGKCGTAFLERPYDEVCRLHSPVVRRIVDLQRASGTPK